MEFKYGISNYLTKVKISNKKRILVEGKEDKYHIKNLLDTLNEKHKIRIDTAENIKGQCNTTSKNNKAKIEQIFCITKNSGDHSNLFFLCDREFLKFDIKEKLIDLMTEHENDGNLSWTLGHSIENYFFKEEILIDAYKYLCDSTYKREAFSLFKTMLPHAFKVVAAITLAARQIQASKYPIGKIKWQDFIFDKNSISFNTKPWLSNKDDTLAEHFLQGYLHYLPIVEASDNLICERICRGHTGMIILQRLYAACIYEVIQVFDPSLAERDANHFSMIKESSIAAALCEAWLNEIKHGSAIYPENLINSVA